MKIFSTILENYRQYKGMIRIDFATGKENITIIQGDNGSGKSNIMNAVVWCLFNDEIFRSKNNEGRPEINESVMASLNTNETANASVSVILGEEKPELEFIRTITYLKSATGEAEYMGGEFKGYQIKSTGHDQIADPEWEVSKRFIPKDLRSFFFFDGEKMDQYFEDTSSVKSNVERISQIDVLDDVIKTLNSTIRAIEKEIGKLSPECQEIEEKRNEEQEKRDACQLKLDELGPEFEALKAEKAKIDEYLKNNSMELVREKSRRRKELESKQESLLQQKEKINEELRHVVANAIPGVYAYFALNHAVSLIEDETNKGTLPPNIKDVFLKELLENGVCICGRSLDESDSCRKNIEELLKKVVPGDVADDATQGKYAIQSILKNVDFRPEFKEKLTKRGILDKELESLNNSISAISEQLKSYDDARIQEMEIKRQTIETQIQNNRREFGKTEQMMIDWDSNIKSYQEAIERSSKDNEKFGYLNRQSQYASHLYTMFNRIKEEIISKVRERLERKTHEHFFRMIWKENAFSDVRIIDLGKKYKISVLSPNGAECLGDLSAGERQVLALSFTAALYGVSGYSVPVIIDTPLGRISGATRDNIASVLPGYLSDTQLIMTMTDTEYTDSVRQKMKGSVGKEYRILYDEATQTSKVVVE